jgi:hypothetical protein
MGFIVCFGNNLDLLGCFEDVDVGVAWRQSGWEFQQEGALLMYHTNHHSIDSLGAICYSRTMTSAFVSPFTPLNTPPLPDPTPSATPVPLTLKPPTVIPLANHP